MPMVRRTRFAFFYIEDDYVFDVEALLHAAVPAPAPEARILALAVLTGERHHLSRKALDVLLSVPAERWIDDGELDPDRRYELADKGLLLSDAAGGHLRALRERDEALAASEWNLYAALYHYMTQWSGADLRAADEEEFELGERAKDSVRAFSVRHGPPPSEFADVRSSAVRPLPNADRDGPLYRTLTARRTTRAFDPATPMALEDLDTVLRYVFGCHGNGQTMMEVACIKRTSPSGGALHPIEAYPIISNVAGIDPGVYQYCVRDHSLALLSALEPFEARRMSTNFMCGQSYFGAAHVSIILTARFYRNYWKYRRHQKAYGAILMDAAHLTQTLYLVSTDLGLGAFVSIAINARDIEERLGFDGITEGVIAMAGCGPRASGASPLEFLDSTNPPDGTLS